MESEILKSNTLLKEITDEVLAEKVKAGSKEAYTELVKRYMKKAYSIAYQFVRNSEDAKDLSQDVFIKIYQSISSFKKGRKFFSWFYRILINHCINFKKKKSISGFNIEELKGYTNSNSTVESEIDKEINHSELKGAVHKAISKLPLKQRKVVILCEIEGFKQQEVSEILKISVGTVRSRLFYARKRLKKYLKNYLI
ncbi:MAG: sigma-70 family RNA polymerase sigma factor [Candidatus Helarchaeota archaeon]|nr:sigma-70 family RNA polymerase sigma factor [Candidatus Helarchaeota archaeon]